MFGCVDFSGILIHLFGAHHWHQGSDGIFLTYSSETR